MNALGIYLLASLTFVIGTILEFAVIMFLQRRSELREYAKVATTKTLMMRRDSFDIKRLSAKIDGMAMVLFLSGYILFNAFYWIIFISKL